MLIPPDQVVEVLANHRAGERDIDTLAESIRTVGLLQPIRVYRQATPTSVHALRPSPSEKFSLAFGHRRLAAARQLGLKEIPAFVFPNEAWNVATIEVERAVENLQRSDLQPHEEAIAVAALVEDLVEAAGGKLEEDAATAEAAARIGRPVRWVRERLGLRRLAPEVQEQLAKGELLVGHALQLARLADHKVQKDLAKCVTWSTAGDDRRVTSVADLARMVEDETTSLRGVPWRLDVVMGELPACDACPHNTSAKQTLFAKLGEQEETPLRCLNPRCYKRKAQLATKEVKRASERLVAAAAASHPAAAGEGLTPGRAAAVAKDFVKPATVARAAQKLAGDGKKKPGKKGKAARPHATAPSRWVKQVKLDQARQEWALKREKEVDQHLIRHPLAAAAFWLLWLHPNWKSWGELPKSVLDLASGFDLAIDAARLSAIATEIIDVCQAEGRDDALRLVEFWDSMNEEVTSILVNLFGVDVGPKPKPADFGLSANEAS